MFRRFQGEGFELVAAGSILFQKTLKHGRFILPLYSPLEPFPLSIRSVESRGIRNRCADQPNCRAEENTTVSHECTRT